jgi:hypothetical protein
VSAPAPLDGQEAAILRVLLDQYGNPDGLSSVEVNRALPEAMRGDLSPLGRLINDMRRRELIRRYTTPSRHGSSSTARFKITGPGRQALDQAERRAREQAS